VEEGGGELIRVEAEVADMVRVPVV
jgi:hypothetical protein